VYFQYFEIVRVEWLTSIFGVIRPTDEGPVVVNTFCTFFKQLKFPGSLRAKHYVANPGRTSFETYITLERTDQPGVLYAAGGAKSVWVNYREEKSVPLPELIKKAVTA
jgi:acyl-CoA thioester hydrolase